MRTSHASELLVIDNGKLVGTLSEQDIWQHCPTSAVVMNEQQVEDLLGHVRVAGIMALQPSTITLDTPLHEVAQRFTPARRQPLVVMQDGVPIGVLSEETVLQALASFVTQAGQEDVRGNVRGEE
jgi:predicted transcriptional regulator